MGNFWNIRLDNKKSQCFIPLYYSIPVHIYPPSAIPRILWDATKREVKGAYEKIARFIHPLSSFFRFNTSTTILHEKNVSNVYGIRG